MFQAGIISILLIEGFVSYFLESYLLGIITDSGMIAFGSAMFYLSLSVFIPVMFIIVLIHYFTIITNSKNRKLMLSIGVSLLSPALINIPWVVLLHV